MAKHFSGVHLCPCPHFNAPVRALFALYKSQSTVSEEEDEEDEERASFCLSVSKHLAVACTRIALVRRERTKTNFSAYKQNSSSSQSRATWNEASEARPIIIQPDMTCGLPNRRIPIPLVRFVCHLWRYESQQLQ